MYATRGGRDLLAGQDRGPAAGHAMDPPGKSTHTWTGCAQSESEIPEISTRSLGERPVELREDLVDPNPLKVPARSRDAVVT